MPRKLAQSLLLMTLAWSVINCETPTTDPDQAARDLLVNTTWMSDGTDGPADQIFAYFYPDGSFLVGGAPAGTWTIDNGVLTLTLTDASQDVTSPPPNLEASLGAGSFAFLYKGVLRHQQRL